MPEQQPPEYMRIAADLRRRIKGGEFPPGSTLPTQPELQEEYDVSPTTVRNAVRELREEGLVDVGRARSGTKVRERPVIHRLLANRYSGAGQTSSTPFTLDQGAAWSEYRLDKRFEVLPAAPDVAELFEVTPGTKLLARHFVFYDAGSPVQMS
ncbi:GntR family transcriptional regulator, partial [Kitasatospora sp. NPDC058965]|uniref:GntR family transcriptional regulator n=1 Tax=Kitasatospora sp. NPDC058965 TaxID=3346682 RepID=UPI00367A27D8